MVVWELDGWVAYRTHGVGDDLDFEVGHGVGEREEGDELYKSVTDTMLDLGSTTLFVSSGIRQRCYNLS